MLNGCNLMPGAEFYVAVDNKGLWPNLTVLPNGEIVAAVYNHPSHGFGCGDVELWASADGGRRWIYRSTVSDHSEDPEITRMNHAVGLNARDELVALVSGWSEGRKPPILPVQVCISDDGGETWQRHVLEDRHVPFGDILRLPDGRLVCPVYEATKGDHPRVYQSSIIFSHDDGSTWGDKTQIATDSEPFVLRCKSGDLLAVGRLGCTDRLDDMLPHGEGTMLYRSTDDGKTWGDGKRLSPQGQENAHLLELQDGRLLLSLTSRIPGLFGVVFRISEDVGETWSAPRVLVSMPGETWHKTDCGYPSSVQIDDGTIITAYYFGPKDPDHPSGGLPWHQRYHMGVARWRAEGWRCS
ncbi:MAG: exo-alpha-sialidase [Planctomycetes bacterium]|nr:exo-alpha-sialidase [Planctomycetota bacterium]